MGRFEVAGKQSEQKLDIISSLLQASGVTIDELVSKTEGKPAQSAQSEELSSLSASKTRTNASDTTSFYIGAELELRRLPSALTSLSWLQSSQNGLQTRSHP